MRPRRPREIAGALLTKGFRSVEGHHHIFWYYHDGQKTSINTKLSHDDKEYDDYLLSLVSRQLRLNARQLSDLLNCPMDAAAYAKLLIDGKHVALAKPQSGSSSSPPKPKFPSKDKRKRR